MKTPPTNCPRCNSRQSFPLLRRPTKLPLSEVSEKYIRCTMCHWESLLSYTTQQLEAAKTRKRSLALQAQHERRQHGTAQLSTQRALERMVHLTSSLTFELEQKILEARWIES